MTTKDFSLGAVLSVTTGRLLADLDDIYAIMSHLASSDVTTIGLMVLAEPAKAALLEQHPALKDIEVPAKFKDEDHVWAWVEEQENLYGKTLPVAPMDEEYHVDPISEYFDFMESRGDTHEEAEDKLVLLGVDEPDEA